MNDKTTILETLPCCADWDRLPRAGGPPPVSGRLRVGPEDFQVDEVLGFEPDESGQHLLVQVRKRGCNTEWVARQLARIAGIKPSTVSYAGRKDRNAVTTQWFSLDLAGKQAPDWEQMDIEGVSVLRSTPHSRKLRRGTLQGNRFRLVLRGLEGDLEALTERLQRVKREGVPNYFGEQRFGHDGGNLSAAAALFEGRIKVRDRGRRGIYLSAARSLLFNRVLARRVEDRTWNRPVAGDTVMLDGTHSIFSVEEVDQTLLRRAADADLHPTGPLWGRGEVAMAEQNILEDCGTWREGLERAGMRLERRSLRLMAGTLEWDLEAGNILHLSFFLPAGSYATTLVRELARPITHVPENLTQRHKGAKETQEKLSIKGRTGPG